MPITPPADLPATVGELRASGHQLRSVSAEVRDNLLAELGAGNDPWPGIVGFESTVLPQLERALIAGHDVVLLGERGPGQDQAAAHPDRAARRVDAGDRRLGDRRAPVRPDHRRNPGGWSDELGDAAADQLAAPQRAVHREAGHPGHRGRRPDRRRRPGQGGAGTVARRPGDHPLRPGPAGAPRHHGDQRTARPGRADPGGAAQRDGGARHPGPRLHRCGCRWMCCWWRRPIRRTTPTAAASSPRSRTGSARRSAPTTRWSWPTRSPSSGRKPSSRRRFPTTCWRSSPGSPGCCGSRPRSTRGRGCPPDSPSPPPKPLRRRHFGGRRSPARRCRWPGRSIWRRRCRCCAGKLEFVTGQEGREDEVLEHLLRRATADTARRHLRGVDLTPLVDAVTKTPLRTGDRVTAAQVVAALPRVEVLTAIAQRLGAAGTEDPGPMASAAELALELLFLTRKLTKEPSDDGDTVSYG